MRSFGLVVSLFGLLLEFRSGILGTTNRSNPGLHRPREPSVLNICTYFPLANT